MTPLIWIVILAMASSGAVIAWALLRRGAAYDASMALEAEDQP